MRKDSPPATPEENTSETKNEDVDTTTTHEVVRDGEAYIIPDAKYIIKSYRIPDSLVLKFSNYPILEDAAEVENLLIRLSFKPVIGGFAQPVEGREMTPSNKEYLKYAEKFGDGNYNDTLWCNESLEPFRHMTYTNGITKIEVKALSDYNANYPKGSSLNEIARVTYGTYKPFIDNGYSFADGIQSKPSNPASQLYYGFKQATFTYVDRPITEDFEIVMPAVHFETFATISFADAPTSEENLAFEVSVTLDNGKVLKATMGK